MDSTALQLEAMLSHSKVNPSRAAEVNLTVQRIIANLNEYTAASQAMGGKIPPAFIGCLHYRENTSLSLKAYLGNGQLIIGTNKRSTIAPVARGPFPTFAAGAIDALTLEGFQHVQGWTPGVCLEEAERWNGMGYRRRGVVNPYLFAGTSLYTSGKFTSDDHYDAHAVDQELGIAPLLMVLEAHNLI